MLVTGDLNEEINEVEKNAYWEGYGDGKNDSVAHAHWICRGDCGVTICSKCNRSVEEYVEWDYCPYCGAKMDEEVTE